MEQVNSQLITCSICLLRGHRQVMLSASDYVKHIRLFHEYSPTFQFTCGINGCPRSYHNVGTFKNHVSEAHGSNDVGSNSTAYPDVPSEPQNSSSTSDAALVNALEDTESSNDDDEYCGEDTTEVICTDLPHCSSKDTLQKSSAMFLLGLKEKFKLTQAATQEMVEGVTNLFQKHISILRSQVIVLSKL